MYELEEAPVTVASDDEVPRVSVLVPGFNKPDDKVRPVVRVRSAERLRPLLLFTPKLAKVLIWAGTETPLALPLNVSEPLTGTESNEVVPLRVLKPSVLFPVVKVPAVSFKSDTVMLPERAAPTAAFNSIFPKAPVPDKVYAEPALPESKILPVPEWVPLMVTLLLAVMVKPLFAKVPKVIVKAPVTVVALVRVAV